MTFKVLSTVTVSSPTSVITFSSIPSNYRDLWITGAVKTTDSNITDGLKVHYNNDTTDTNYFSVYGGTINEAAFAYFGDPNNANIRYICANAGTNVLGSLSFYIHGYENSAMTKVADFTAGVPAVSNNTSAISWGGYRWNSTSTISTISLYSRNGYNWAAGTDLTLYGIG